MQTFTTIQAGIDAAQPGDTVRVPGGKYFENLTISNKSGTTTKPITLESAPGETVIIDGAYKPLTRAGNGEWRAEPGVGVGVYSASVPYAGIINVNNYPPNEAFASLADETSLWTYSTLAQFKDFFSGQGVYRESPTSRLYIRLTNNANPNQLGLNISTSHAAVYITNSSHWVFRNIDFRHGGYATIYTRFTVDSVHFENIRVKTVGNGFKSDSGVRRITVSNCSLFNGWPREWWYSDVKNIQPKAMEVSGFNWTGVSDSEINDCEVDGFFNGINTTGSNLLIHHNVIHDILDDGFEPDNHDGNGRIDFYNNLIYQANTGMSLAPARGGPIYIYRNVVVADRVSNSDRPTGTLGPRQVFKIGGDSGASSQCATYCPSENVKLYHNTFYGQKGVIANTAWDELWQRFEFYNNIFYSEADPVISNSGLAADGNIYNGNLYFRQGNETGTKNLILRWNTDKSVPPHNFKTLTAARTFYSGWEEQGRDVDPQFTGGLTPVPDLRIRQTSPAKNTGIGTPKQKGWPDSMNVTDGKPDIGAYEYGQALPDVSPTTVPAPTLKQILRDWLTTIYDQNGDGKVDTLDFARLIYV